MLRPVSDIEGDAATDGKATAVAVLGVAISKELLTALVGDAAKSLAPFGTDAAALQAAARFVAERDFERVLIDCDCSAIVG